MNGVRVSDLLYAISDLEFHERAMRRSKQDFLAYLIGMARIELLRQVKQSK